MKMEPIVSSETSAIRTQTPGNYPKRNKLHLEHGESLKTRRIILKSLHCLQALMFSWKLETSAKAINNQQAVQLSRNLMLHILFLYNFIIARIIIVIIILLKGKFYTIFPLIIARTYLHGDEICLSSKTKMHLRYIKNLRCRWQWTRFPLKIQIFC